MFHVLPIFLHDMMHLLWELIDGSIMIFQEIFQGVLFCHILALWAQTEVSDHPNIFLISGCPGPAASTLLVCGAHFFDLHDKCAKPSILPSRLKVILKTNFHPQTPVD